MAKNGLTIKTDLDIPFLNDLKKAYPQAMFGVLSQIGIEGRVLMKAGLLSGNPIELRKHPRDKAGRRTVNYKILNGIKGVRISSYPLNLYEPRKQYRKFSPVIASKIDSIVKSYSKNEFQKIVNQYDK